MRDFSYLPAHTGILLNTHHLQWHYLILKKLTTMNNDNHQRMIEFINQLDKRLKDRSDELEDVHLEAAIDAQLTSINGAESNSDPVMVASRSNNDNYNDGFQGHEAEKENVVIFHDYSNPNAVSNCLSPYVPSTPEKIAAFVSWTGLSENDILLDIGCGDGRVCVAASKLSGN